MQVSNITMPQGIIKKEYDEDLMKVSKEFEAIFVNQMVSTMRKTVAKGGLVPESNAEKIYQSMLDYEYSKKISDSGQIGLWKIVYDHLLHIKTLK